jgi:hypothetical protein
VSGGSTELDMKEHRASVDLYHARKTESTSDLESLGRCHEASRAIFSYSYTTFSYSPNPQKAMMFFNTLQANIWRGYK